MKPTLDRAAAPLLLATFYPTITASEAQAHFQEIGDAADELGHIGVVVDLADVPLFSAALRRLAGREMRRLFRRCGDKIAAVAHLVRAAPARSLLAAVQWIAPPPFPTLATSSREEALGWVAAHLDRRASARQTRGRRDARVAAGFARVTVTTAAAREVTIGPFELDRLDISCSSLAADEGSVPYGSLLDLIALLARRTADPHFGLHVGEGLSDAGFGIVGLGARCSPTLHEALARVAAHLLLVDENARLTLKNDAAGLLICAGPQPPLDWPRHYAELFMAGLLTACRRWSGARFDACSAGFRHPAPDDAREHLRIFGTPPAFGANENFVVIPSAFVARPLVWADPLLCRYLDARLAERTRALGSGPGPIADVRSAILEALSAGVPSLRSIGRHLGLSSRTLQRRLNERGITFGTVLDSVRREVAMATIARRGASVQEVASRCGFEDAKALQRAFRRWTGKSTGEYRRTQT